MRTVILCMIWLAAAMLHCNAQQTKPKFSLNLTAGPSFPIGDFGNKTFSFYPDSSGLAKTGPLLSLKFAYRAKSKIGLAFVASGATYLQDKKSYEIYPNSVVEVHKWEVLKFLIGPEYFIPMGKTKDHFIFYFGGYAGLCKANLPAFRVTELSSTGYPFSQFWRDKMPLKWAFSYQFETGLEYSLSSRWFIGGDLEFFNTQNLHSSKYDHYPNVGRITTVSTLLGVGLRL